MTSWISAPRQRKVVRERVTTYQVSDGGFCSAFNNYLYSLFYASKKGISLHVSDMPNSVATNYPLLRSLFVNQTNVVFEDVSIPPAMSIHLNRKELSPALADLTADTLRSTARATFRFKPEVEKQIGGLISAADLPPSFDVAVHIRGGDWRSQNPVTVEDYVNAVKAFQKKGPKPVEQKDLSGVVIKSAPPPVKPLTVFVLSDDVELYKQFRKRADPSWLMYTMPQLQERTGYVHSQFGRLPRKTRQDALFQFLAELKIAQETPAIVCALGNHVGKFLYMTANSVTQFKSVDTPYFTPF